MKKVFAVCLLLLSFLFSFLICIPEKERKKDTREHVIPYRSGIGTFLSGR